MKVFLLDTADPGKCLGGSAAQVSSESELEVKVELEDDEP